MIQINRVLTRIISGKAGTRFVLVTALLLSFLFFSGCQKELDIADFADEYGDYQPELRIEAILDVVDPLSSIVRVDRTILVTDTVIFNGRDDDGDWNSLTDDVGEDGIRADPGGFGPPKDEGEGNGRPDQGEPHVDELDEILPQIHDSTATVALFDLTLGGLAMDFTWDPRADSFTVVAGPSQGFSMGEDEILLEVVTYGGYKPVSMYSAIDMDHLYLFQITASEQEITGVVQPLPPPVFDLDPQSMIGDTVMVASDSSPDQFTWITVPEATVFWVQVEEVLAADSLRTIVSHPGAPVERRQDGYWIGMDIPSLYLPGLYRWTVSVPSRAYGAYVYSQLPMRDEQLSNLRDQDGTVVLGIAGSAASASQYVRITAP